MPKFYPNEVKLFSIYSDIDQKIIEVGSNNGLILMGGSAIEMWLKHLNLIGWRKRSNNDIDFTGDANKITDYMNNVVPKLEKLGLKLIRKYYLYFKLVSEKASVDILLDIDKDLEKYGYSSIKGINVVNPEYIIIGKLNRYHDEKAEVVRKEVDILDITDLLKILHKLNRLEKFIKSLDNEDDKKLLYMADQLRYKLRTFSM